MLKEILKIPNGKLIMDYEIYQCDCCGAEIEEAHPFYYEEPNKHVCGDCAFINGYITEKEFLEKFCFWCPFEKCRAAVKDGKVFITTGKFPWEKKPSADRFTSEYKEWRTSVFKRDNFTCQKCGIVGGELNAHHIKPYAKYKELRYELSNGITLCEDCHKLVHKRRKNNGIF